MHRARGSSAPLVRPEFGPTLPALLHRRLGVPQPLTVAAVALVLLAAAVAIALRMRADDTVELVHRAQPAFTLLYAPAELQRVAPRPGELVRLHARGPGVALSVTVRPLRLPPYPGVAGGELPVYAERHRAALRRWLEDFELRDEGKARINDVPGYQLGYRAGSAPRRIYGRDVLLVPDAAGARDGVVLRFLQRNTGPALGPSDLNAIHLAKKAFRSFRFGTERP